ncbi:MAG TPA: Fe-S cluster assembly protein SufD, partial [Dehalococcoidia bacterium]|nr:Fe-S cluster assembly protein SufD [Dehalococcoidia bacterium]
DWLTALRRQAFDRFSELGFPTARKGNEPWKYTNVAPIAKTDFSYAFGGAIDAATLRRLAPWYDDWPALVFVNGRYAPDLSTPPPPGAARVAGLAQALAGDSGLIEAHLARYAPFQDEAFTALNTAFLRDGAFVHVPSGVALDRPLHLLFVATRNGAPTVSYPRLLVITEPESSLTLIETYVSPPGVAHFTDAVTEITLGEGSRLDHYRLLLESMDSFHVGVTRVHQERDSTLTTATFQKGAGLARHDLHVLLDAPGASAYLRGLYVTGGSQHLDNYINIDHAQPHTTSRLYYRGILDGKSRAVFGGTVFVRPGAVKADAYQEDKNLVLSAEAEVDSKPSLEIYADDVKCGHGATAGAVAEDALFYMQSRGLDLQTATMLLIKGFADEVLGQVRPAALRRYLERLALRGLAGARFALAT